MLPDIALSPGPGAVPAAASSGARGFGLDKRGAIPLYSLPETEPGAALRHANGREGRGEVTEIQAASRPVLGGQR